MNDEKSILSYVYVSFTTLIIFFLIFFKCSMTRKIEGFDKHKPKLTMEMLAWKKLYYKSLALTRFKQIYEDLNQFKKFSF